MSGGCVGCGSRRVRVVCVECAMHDRIAADHSDEVEHTDGADECDCYSCALSSEMRSKGGDTLRRALRDIAFGDIIEW